MTTRRFTGALRAQLSASAVASNLALLREAGDEGGLDLRADCWGHGADFVSSITRATDGVASAPLLDNGKLLGLTPGFTPVMTLVGTVLSTKPLRAGEGVSYGYTHRAPADTTVALVTGGYAHGVVRALGNRADVVIGGRWHPIVGRVAMDACVVDVGDAAVDVGDAVTFFGVSPSITQWAEATGLRVGELVTAIGLRNAREVTE